MQGIWLSRRKPSFGQRLSFLLLAALAAGCASTGAFHQGNDLAEMGNWDAAVDFYRQAVQENPRDPEYRIALERAMRQASRGHEGRARELEGEDEFPAALAEYRRASELDPTNGQLIAIVAALEQRIRSLVEESRPPSALDLLQERARVVSQPTLLNPASEEPLGIQFRNASLRDILDFIGNATGINVTYDQQFQDRLYSVELDEVTIEEALGQILMANQYFYKVVSASTVIIVPDTPQKRAQYEEQVIRTFYVSHADVSELATLLTQVVRAPTLAVQPQIVPNTTSNTITVRATTAIAGVIEQVIAANDKPLAEVVVDVEILEINRERAREFGLDLTQYSIGGLFSPSSRSTGSSGPNSLASGAFSADLLSGVSASDFYLAVPAAIIDFLESDSETRLVAKPQLRGQEGSQLTLNLGDDIPVPSTSFTAIATGGVAVNPLTSFEYRAVGVNLLMTPRVTYDNEIILDLEVENSTLGPNIDVAGQALPTFGTRRVITTLRLRDGESNLLAGLLREEDRRSLRGFPGLLHLPIIRQLFSANDESISSTDIVMLLTPRIVRTHELTQEDVNPIFIGTQQNMGISGPPPLIAPVSSNPPNEVDSSNDLSPSGTGDASGDAIMLSRPHIAVTPAMVGDITVGSGGYTVPIMVSGADEISTFSLSVKFDPEVLRVSSVREGNFAHQDGDEAAFAKDVDAVAGRIDLALTRSGPSSDGRSSGLIAAVVFEPVAPGVSVVSPSGLGLTSSGTPLTLSFEPTTISVR